MDALLQFLSLIPVRVVIAGMAGGVMRSIFYRTKTWDAVLNVVSGALLAAYVSPYLAPMFAPVLSLATADVGDIRITVGFLTGVSGVVVLGFIIDRIQLKKPEAS